MSDQTVQHRQGDDIVAEVPPYGDKRVRNVEISNLIQKLAKLYQKAPFDKNDEMRAYTFFLVAGRLKCLDFDVATDPMASEKLKNTKGIGESCLKIINEWIRTRKISRLEQASEQETRISFRNLIQIWGVGPTKARELHHQNYRTIEQVREGLRKRELSLNDNQLVGVECYEDFLLKMTRTEVQVIRDIVCRELSEMLPTATVEIMGSYRRGKEECGDIDLLITDPNYIRTTPRLALGELVSRLEEKGHISHHLTNITDLGREDRSDSQSSCGRRGDYDHYDKSQSYMGVFCSPVDQGKHRRIDIKIYPYRSKAFATLYFTGCGWFNRSMRLWAKRAKNLHLNDHGLFPGDGRLHHVPSVNEQLPFEASTEMEIFAKLGLVYKQPQERNCFDDVVSKDGETVAKLDINDTEAYREERLRNNLDVYEELED
jgi:DNA polymerase/3'-5' exonuclease PolX